MQLVRTNMFATGIFAPHLLFIAAAKATADRKVVCVCVCLESHPPYVRYCEINDAEREGNTSYNSLKKTEQWDKRDLLISHSTESNNPMSTVSISHCTMGIRKK